MSSSHYNIIYSLSTKQDQLSDLLWMSPSHYNIAYQQNRINYQIYCECHHHTTIFLINKTGSIIRFTVNVTIALQYSLPTKQDQLSDIFTVNHSTIFLINKTGSIIRFIGNVTIKHHKYTFGEIVTWHKTKIWIIRTGIQVKEVLRMGTVILIADLVSFFWRLPICFRFSSLFCLEMNTSK